MIGGKVRPDETYYEAGMRELKEETALSPNLFWSIPSINQFYDHLSDQIFQIPAFGAQIVKGNTISLNHEHISWKWISQDEIDTYIQWPEQERLMKLLTDIITTNKILDEWIIEV